MAHLPKGKGVIPLPPFQAWLSSNIPAVYDNTMTYYEELCALLKYLQDQVVPALNENSEAITIISEYVEHYFDNLDIQTEINNKLDQMAEDGTLQEIMGAYLSTSAVWGFDTVADMQDGSNLINGSFAKTLGYRTRDDRGGAMYKIRNITNEDTIDGAKIIKINDEADLLIAELVVDTYVTPEQFGAYGDGVHDDTTALNNALADYEVVGEGKYLASGLIDLNTHNLDIREFAGTPVLTNKSDADHPVKVSIDKADTLTLQDFKNSDFYLGIVNTLNITASNASNAFAYNTIHGGHAKSLYIYGNETTAWVNENIFDNIRVSLNLSLTADGYHHNNNRFYDITVEDSTAITISGCHGNFFSYRGETNPTITMSQDNYTYGNVFYKNWYSFFGGYPQGDEKIEKMSIFRSADCCYLNDYSIYNATIDGTTHKMVLPQYSYISTFYVKPSNGGCVRFESDSSTLRFIITPLDADGNTYANDPSAIIASGINWNNTMKNYQHSTSVSKASFVINTNANVHLLKVQLYNFAASETEFTNMTYSAVRPAFSFEAE